MPCPFPAGSLVLPYLRDSGGREQDASVERQRAEIAAWAAQNDLIIPRWFLDPARSGRSTAGREHFLELIEYLTSGARPERGVVFWEYARFARNFDDMMYYLAELRRRGYIAWSISDEIPDTLEGRLLESMSAWKDAKYRQDLARNVRSGLHRLVATYQAYPQRKPPIGYARAPLELPAHRDGSAHIVHRLIPDPDQAPAVAQAFALRAEGGTYAEIHNALHLTASHISLSRILRDPIYVGTFHFGDREYPGFCPPIVSVETWEAAQRVNQARRARHGFDGPRAARSRFVLTGLLYCARCGAGMYGRVVQRKPYRSYDYYRCRNSGDGKAASCRAPLIPKEQMEALVMDHLELALQPESLGPLLEQARASLAGQEQHYRAELARLQRRSGEVERSIANVLRAIKASGHSRALIDELAGLEAQRDEVAAAIASHASSAPQSVDLRPDELQERIGPLLKKLRGKPAESVVILRGLVVEVRAQRVSGGSPIANRARPIRAEITYRLPFGLPPD